jgi:putative CocE/NonD family hydrolase
MVPMRDGTRLATDVYSPALAPPLPTLLLRSPYGKRTAVTLVMFRLERALDRGYHVVVQDTRGRFASEGRFKPFRPDIEDGYDTIEWIRRQPFSDGNVVMAGSSYLGATQWLAALSGHPALKAIAPALTASDYYEGWTYQGGAFQLAFNLFWVLVHLAPEERRRQEEASPAAQSYAGEAPVYRRAPGGASSFPASQASMEIAGPWLSTLPLGDVAPVLGVADYYLDWLAYPEPEAPYWQAISPERNVGRIHCPILAISGWYQLFLRGAYEGLSAVSASAATEAAREFSAMVIGPWENSVPDPANTRAGQIEFGATAGIDFEGTQLDYFDAVLGRTLGRPPRIRYFTMGRDEWRSSSTWPPSGTKWTPLFAAADGRLSWQRPEAEHAYDRTKFDPEAPAPTLGGNTVPGLPQGPQDHRGWLGRPDAAVYRSEPLTSAIEITGPVVGLVHVESTAESLDVVVLLAYEEPGGRLINICDGIRRLTAPARGAAVEVDLLATSIELPAGVRLVLLIHHSNYPRFDINRGTMGSAAFSTERERSDQRIFRSVRQATRVLLPVV